MKGDSSYLSVRSGVESTRNLRAASVGNSGQSRGSDTETLLLFSRLVLVERKGSGASIQAGLSLCAFGLGGANPSLRPEAATTFPQNYPLHRPK